MGKERRVYKRVPFTENVLINNAIMVKAIDISEGGLYLHTGRSFNPGTVVDVTIPLRGKKITVKAIIQHNQPAVGMGLQYVKLSDANREMIKNYIDSFSTRQVASKTEKKKVLMIEEDEMLRRINKSKLTLEGFSVFDTGDGMEAIRHLEEETPDLIVLNLFLTKIDGFKILAILRESPKWKDIPVIVFSAKGTQDVIDKVINAGAEEFLLKMMTSPAKLAKTVKTVIEKKSG
jgi:CheY-like chemotaxis protein